ncbi:MAG: hypothetical protein SCK70_13920, partial [bacterium]|nr:hypothetical protein [bacterium]
MNPQTQTVVIALLLLCVFSNSHSQSVNVPLNHWAYSFLERLETRGFFNSQLLKTRPISRNDLANILAELNKKHLNEQIKLSRTEMDMFEQLKGEFYEELFQLSVRASSKY